MGFAISWLAVRDDTEASLFALLGLEKAGETQQSAKSDWCTARVKGWTIVWSNSFEPRRFRNVGSKFKGEIVFCDVEEHVMFVSSAAFKNGSLSWRVTHDAQKSSDHLVVEGTPPESLSRIRAEEFARAGEDPDVDCLFEVPVRLAEEIVGFRHDGGMRPVFEDLRATLTAKSKWKFG